MTIITTEYFSESQCRIFTPFLENFYPEGIKTTDPIKLAKYALAYQMLLSKLESLNQEDPMLYEPVQWRVEQVIIAWRVKNTTERDSALSKLAFMRNVGGRSRRRTFVATTVHEDLSTRKRTREDEEAQSVTPNVPEPPLKSYKSEQQIYAVSPQSALFASGEKKTEKALTPHVFLTAIEGGIRLTIV